jgi:N-acetyl-anhydromuramyl-L-alanine amidase AmpD
LRVKHWLAAAAMAAVVGLTGCKAGGPPPAVETAPANKVATGGHAPGALLQRTGDEIVVCGQLFHTGAPVVLWMDPGGYDAYRTDRRFAPYEVASYEATQRELLGDEGPATRAATRAVAAAGAGGAATRATTRSAAARRGGGVDSPARYNMRYTPPPTQPATRPILTGRQFMLSPEELEKARGGWALEDLRDRVDQFVYHYDVAGTSRTCFKVLHDMRGLSVHFMVDLDGTIYQTLDLKERAFHATTSNTRSVGIEIANMGAYPTRANNAASEWYAKGPDGRTVIRIPARHGDGGIRDKSVTLRPARDEIVTGVVQGRTYHQWDLTPQQYDSLIKLTATLCTVFPKMKCDYPRGADGKVIPQRLTDEQLADYQGLLGHYHVQRDKQDPGPAFQWDRVIDGARALMRKERVAGGE